MKPNKKKKRKTLAQLKQTLQKLVNTYIRKRDEGKPCISCGKVKKLQAGHYYAVSGYDGLRFNENNINGECAGCNCFDQSHLITYGKNLEKKIGVNKMIELHAAARDYKRNGNKFDRNEIEEKIEYYKLKLKQ